MKRILYIHQYFQTPIEGGAIRSYHIARGLVGRGMEVSMITSHNKPKYEYRVVDGIEVHYLPVAYSNEYAENQRIMAFLKFVMLSLRLFRKLATPDLVYATSTPLTVGLITLWLKWRKGIQYVFEVRDLWPEAPIQLEVIKSRWIAGISEALEAKIYRHAQRIVALSPGIEKGIKNRCKRSPVTMIPNMSDTHFYHLQPTHPSDETSLSIGYFGAFGVANHVESVLNIALACLRENLSVRFVLAGSGAKRSEIERSAHQLGIENMEFYPPLNRFEVRDLMNTVDAVLISFMDKPVLGTASPNKFFDGLAAGKLVILNHSGWLRDLVEKNNCGFYYDQNKPKMFTSKIKVFLQDREKLRQCKQNARSLAESEFSTDQLVARVCDLIEKI